MRERGFNPQDSFLVAYSGGLDSSVLLDLAVAFSSDPQNLIRAVYVHHGLSDNADQWQYHCGKVCAAYSIEFHSAKVDLSETAANLEAEARRSRYQAMQTIMKDGETLLLGHHRGDQAETFFLNLMRGAGLRGLSGIPASGMMNEHDLFRPLLDLSREELETCARERGLSWVTDESNSDDRFDRNFLRRRIVPSLIQRWPFAEKAISRACENLADSSQLLNEVAADDMSAVSVPETRATAVHRVQLSLERMRQLSRSRRNNLLGYILRRLAGYAPSRRLLQMLAALLESDKTGKQLAYADWIIHRYNGSLYFYRSEDTKPVTGSLSREVGEMPIRWGPYLLSAKGGAALDVRISARQGGEKIRLAGRSHSHSLKKILQEKRIPPWERRLLPLIYLGEKLVAIPGVFQPAELAGAEALNEVAFHLQQASK